MLVEPVATSTWCPYRKTTTTTLQRLLVISSGATEPIAKQVMYVYMYYVNHEASRSGLSETQITSRWLTSSGATEPNAIYGAKTI